MLKGAKYGKAVIHKRAKRQSTRPDLIANRLQFKFARSELKRFKRVYSDNNHLPSLETFHFPLLKGSERPWPILSGDQTSLRPLDFHVFASPIKKS